MRTFAIAMTLWLMANGAIADTWPRIKANKDGSQVYQYQSGTTCIKQADYATERTISGKASITKVFSAEGNSSQKVVDALSYSPSVSALHAALFDMCTAYGSGTITKQQYDEERDALSKLQIAVIEKEAGQNLTTGGSGKSSGSDETSSKNSRASDKTSPDKTTASGGDNSEAPASDKTKTPAAIDPKIAVPPSETTQPKSAVQSAKNEMPAPKPVAPGLDPHYDGLFMQYQGDEATLAKLGEEAFSRLDYAWTIKFLEQAKTVQGSKVWERDFPYLAAAYLLGNGDRDKFQATLQDMLAEMRLNNSFLHHGPPIAMALQNLSNIRPYLDKEAQAYIDKQIVPEAIRIKQNVG
jgi:hypothetical protein